MIALLPVVMAFLARLSGGGMFAPKIWSRLPEVLFAVPFGVYAWIEYGWYWGVVGFVCSCYAMEMGHGTFYAMNGYNDHNRESDKPRIQTLEKVFRPLYIRLGGNIMKPAYSWYMMAIKGMLIGLPAAPWGLLLAALWPLSYWIGHRVEKNAEVSEWVSGMAAGLVLALAFVY